MWYRNNVFRNTFPAAVSCANKTLCYAKQCYSKVAGFRKRFQFNKQIYLYNSHSRKQVNDVLCWSTRARSEPTWCGSRIQVDFVALSGAVLWAFSTQHFGNEGLRDVDWVVYLDVFQDRDSAARYEIWWLRVRDQVHVTHRWHQFIRFMNAMQGCAAESVVGSTYSCMASLKLACQCAWPMSQVVYLEQTLRALR